MTQEGRREKSGREGDPSREKRERDRATRENDREGETRSGCQVKGRKRECELRACTRNAVRDAHCATLRAARLAHANNGLACMCVRICTYE